MYSVFDSFLDSTIDIKAESWETSAYIKATLKKYVKVENDLSDKSMVLMYFDATNKRSFSKYQDIGDWVLFTDSFFPGTIKCDEGFYKSIGKNSYYKCYTYLNRQVKVYEELADRFDYFVNQIRKSFVLTEGFEPPIP